MTDARAVALDCLLQILEKGAYSHLVLGKALDQLSDPRDRAFAARLTEGVIERLYELDYIIDCFSKVRTEKLKPVIRELLRMGVYQLKYMDVPDRAAVGESVRLAAKRGFSSLKGYVNGVLRAAARGLSQVSFPSEEEDFFSWARIRFSVQEWIVEELSAEYGRERTKRLLEAGLQERPVTGRAFLSRAPFSQIKESIEAQGASVTPVDGIPGAFTLRGAGDVRRLSAFQEGLFQIQDVSSMLAGLAAAPEEGGFVVDVCAAPGGKSLHAADLLRGTGHVEARDVSGGKAALIEENIKRSRLANISARVHDARVPDSAMDGRADVVIADLPCSGLGIIGRKGDIKYKMTKEAQRELSALQREILDTVWRYVKPGGRLVYSTCTLLPSENRKNAEWFLENHPFTAEELKGRIPQRFFREGAKKGQLQLLPGESEGDGFFIAAFRREKL